MTVPQLSFFETASLFAQWSLLEPGIGIVANSLATLRPLLRTLSRHASTTLGNSNIDSNEHSKNPSSLTTASHATKGFVSESRTGIHDSTTPHPMHPDIELGTITSCSGGTDDNKEKQNLRESVASAVLATISSSHQRSMSRTSIRSYLQLGDSRDRYTSP